MVADLTSTERGSSCEVLLRALGRQLDENDATDVRVLEVPSGFFVQFRQHGGTNQLVTLDRTYKDLANRQSSFPYPHVLKRHRSMGHVSYENLFRALGYELDQVSAWTLLIEELTDGLMLTYQFLNPVEGYMMHKKIVTPTWEETEALVQSATSRRKKKRRKLLLIGA
ncbi:MAG TPA: hypothetical protein VF898_08310 [Chloroflexota bacterium]